MRRNRDARSNGGAMRKLTGNHSVVADARRKLDLVESRALSGEPDGEHGAEQCPRHDRRMKRRILVADRNHWPGWRDCVRNVTQLVVDAANLAHAFGPRLAF